MTIKPNGTRYSNKGLYEKQLNRPYDYAREGLLKHIMSRRITRSRNPILQYVLQIVEQSLIFQMKYVDILQNIHNYNWKNR